MTVHTGVKIMLKFSPSMKVEGGALAKLPPRLLHSVSSDFHYLRARHELVDRLFLATAAARPIREEDKRRRYDNKGFASFYTAHVS